jgi:hypothetical protein
VVMPALVDADDAAERGEVIALRTEVVGEVV